MRRLLPALWLAAAAVLPACKDTAGNQNTQQVPANAVSATDPASPYEGYPASDAQVESVALVQGQPGSGFTRLDTAQTGISFVSLAESRELRLDDLASQAGLAAGDYDQDGDIDLYLCGIENDNLLFRNEGGFRFTDVTDIAGKELRVPGELAESAVFADVNGDGWLDLYVAVRGGANRLFISDGKGGFSEQGAAFGLDSRRSTVVSAVFDFDNDGDLDIYNANNRKGRNEDGLIEEERSDTKFFGFLVNQETGEVRLDDESSQDYYLDNSNKIRFKPDSDEFFINDGQGRFQNGAASIGIVPDSWSLNALATDFNNDGWIDLQVSGDYDTPDWYYLNNGKGFVREMGRSMLRINSFYGMGSDAGDLNHDGLMDYIVGDMSASGYKDSKKQSGDMYISRAELRNYTPHQNMRNTAFLNRGDGWMTEIGALLGIKSTDWTWSFRLADLDNNGVLDVLATNGYITSTIEYDVQRRLKQMRDEGATQEQLDDYKLSLPALKTDDIIFSAAEPMKYEKAPDNWGIHDQAISCGCVLQDMDGDGDLDFIVNNTNDELGVYRNDLPEGNRVLIDLRQAGPNREAVGARVMAICGGERFMQDVILARGYASTESSRVHLGLGKHEKIDTLWIRWPDNRCEVLHDLAAGMHHTIHKGSRLVDNTVPVYRPLFRQEELGWEQKEADTFDAEFEAEPLLPIRRSTLGTGIGVADINADGHLDVYFAGPAAETGKLFTGREGGGVISSPMLDKITDASQENMAALFFEADGDGRPDLLLSSGSNEAEAGSTTYIDRLMLNEAGGFKLASMSVAPVSSGSACATDIDADGDLDVFIAGRQKVHEYLRPEQSSFLSNEGAGRFSLTTGRVAPGIAESGPIADAVFSDLNGDGRQDLVVALEFGEVEWWADSGGLLVRQGGISGGTGTWQSLATGDFDNDGDIDVLAGNYGLNTKYHPSPGKPYLIIADDFDDNGTRDLVEVKFGSDGTMLPGRGRSCSGYAITTIPQRFDSWEKFAEATLEDVYGPVEQAAEQYSAEEVRSCLFVNEGGGKFSKQPLPGAAQYSIVLGMAVGDFNNDGNLDAWLNQNFRNTQPEETRWVSCYGTLMLGDGKAGFSCLEPQESGLLVNAEGRGAVAADLNQDGFLDIVISVSSAHPQIGWGIPENLSGHTLAVTLQGKPGNPRAVGALLRLELSDGRTLTREVQAGHTYLSSFDGPVYFGIPEAVKPLKLSVRWPDGSSSELKEFGKSEQVVIEQGS